MILFLLSFFIFFFSFFILSVPFNTHSLFLSFLVLCSYLLFSFSFFNFFSHLFFWRIPTIQLCQTGTYSRPEHKYLPGWQNFEENKTKTAKEIPPDCPPHRDPGGSIGLPHLFRGWPVEVTIFQLMPARISMSPIPPGSTESLLDTS